MTNPAAEAADVLALRLILSMQTAGPDVDTVNFALESIGAAVTEDRATLPRVCIALGARVVGALGVLGSQLNSPDYGTRVVAGWLQKTLDDADKPNPSGVI
jgi:hypothetical protein